MICLTPRPRQSFFVYRIQSKEKNFTEKDLFKESVEWRIEQKRKDGFLTAPPTMIKKDPTMSRRKHTNELKVYDKTVITAIKEDLSPNLNPWLRYMGGFRKQTNATSYQNIGSLNIFIDEERNKISEEFSLKTCKLFRRCVDTLIEKKNGGSYWVNLLFCVYLLILLFISQNQNNFCFIIELPAHWVELPGHWVECSSMAWETWVQYQVASYQKL